jgi:hypothetical protein
MTIVESSLFLSHKGPMPKPKTPPIHQHARNIDIAQGDCIAKGIILEAEYDDGWHYRVEVTGGDDCNRHREQSGELWCGDFEVQPAGTAQVAAPRPLPHTVDVVEGMLVVLDEEQRLRCLQTAEPPRIKRHPAGGDHYAFDYGAAMRATSEYFAALRPADEAGRQSMK